MKELAKQYDPSQVEDRIYIPRYHPNCADTAARAP